MDLKKGERSKYHRTSIFITLWVRVLGNATKKIFNNLSIFLLASYYLLTFGNHQVHGVPLIKATAKKADVRTRKQ